MRFQNASAQEVQHRAGTSENSNLGHEERVPEGPVAEVTPIEGGRQGTETAVMTEEATIGEIVIEEALGTTEGQRGGITPEVNAEKDIGQMTREEGEDPGVVVKVFT